MSPADESDGPLGDSPLRQDQTSFSYDLVDSIMFSHMQEMQEVEELMSSSELDITEQYFSFDLYSKPEPESPRPAIDNFSSGEAYHHPTFSAQEYESEEKLEGGSVTGGAQENTHTSGTKPKQSNSKCTDGVDASGVALDPSPQDPAAWQHLASELAHMVRSLPLESDTELIAEHRLPGLLKSYSERLQTPPQVAVDLRSLVSNNAKNITSLTMNILRLQPQPKYIAPVAMSKWLSDIPVWDSARICSVASTASRGNALKDTPMAELSSLCEAILVKSPAFKWLCASIVKDFILQPDSHLTTNFRNTIEGNITSRQRIVSFKFHWELADFLEQEYGDKNQTLGEVITITGTSDRAQAVTCSTYLNQVWPCVGSEILCAIQDAFRRPDGNQGVPKTSELQLSDGKTSVTANFQPNTTAFWLNVKGTRETISEAGEVVTWIVGALHSSKYETGIHILPKIGQVCYGGDWQELHIDYSLLVSWNNEQGGMPHSPNMPNGKCWQAMFRNPVVVSGFPSLRRPHDLGHCGLEISLDMMASLVQASRLTEYAGRYYLKGFSSMLIAVEKIGGIVLWHHYFNPSGGRVSYLEAETREGPDCQHISIEDILSARHIIGWCNNAQFKAGDPDIAYGSIKSSGLRFPSRNFFLEKISLSTGDIVPLTLGVSFAIGKKDMPIHIFPDSYILKLKWVHGKSVVLWDEADKRGWLLNGIDVLFHLLRSSLESCRTDKFSSLFVFDFSKFNIHTETNKVSAIKTLEDRNNRRLGMYVRDETPHTSPKERGATDVEILTGSAKSYITLQDKVEELIGTLERMFDHQSEVQTSKGISAKVRLSRHLEGWDFCDLALGRDPLHLRVASLDMGSVSWVEFTRKIGAVTLLGKGFGEMIVPAPDSSRTSCQKWATIPKGKYYLCAGVDDILNIIADTSSVDENEGATVKLLPLTRQLGWLNPSPRGHPFSACPCSTKDSPTVPSDTNCCPVQFVVSSTMTKVPRLFRMQHRIMPSHLEESRNGAVIFGQGLGNLIRRLWLDNEVDQPGTLIPMEVSAQPNNSSLESNQQVLNTPPSGSGSGSSDSTAQTDRTTPSPTADPSHPSSSRLLNNNGKSQVLRLLPLSQNRHGCDATTEPIDRKQKGKNVIRQSLTNCVIGNR